VDCGICEGGLEAREKAKKCRDIRRIKREERYERMGVMTRGGRRVVSVACSPFENR
jgi:hypothetical protein